ncbi:MAG: LEPR-XLL domain-containing protein, partial [Verrucomicrobia bacterium]|nr:LEPR-XLL domain-containing protein [Verrucomicrobiota bacterium]
MKVKQDTSRNRFSLEALEPRVMLSADAVLIAGCAAQKLDSPITAVAETASAPVSQAEAQIAYQPTDLVNDLFAGMVVEALPVSIENTASISADSVAPTSVAPVSDSTAGATAVDPTTSSKVTTSVAATQGGNSQTNPTTPSVTGSNSAITSGGNALSDQLVTTLNAANGPPAGTTSSADPASEFVDPDFLAGPKSALLNGLTALGNWANTLDTYSKLAANLPIIGGNIGSLLDIGAILLTRFRDPIQAYFTGDSTPTTDELNVIIENLDFSGGGLVITSTLTGGGLTGSDFRFNVNFLATRTISGLPISFTNASGLDAAVKVSGGAQVSATTTLTLNFGFGLRNLVETSPGNNQWDLSLPADQSFFIAPSSFTATAAVHATGMNYNVRVGFMDVSVTGGTADMDGNAGISLNDPNSDGKITQAEFSGTALATLVSTTLTGSASASLPITNSLFAGTQTLNLNWADVNAPTALTSNIASLLNYNQFSTLTPATLTGGFTNFANWTDALNNGSSDANLFAGSLPIIGGQLKTVVDIKNLLLSRLVTQVGSF